MIYTNGERLAESAYRTAEELKLVSAVLQESFNSYMEAEGEYSEKWFRSVVRERAQEAQEHYNNAEALLELHNNLGIEHELEPKKNMEEEVYRNKWRDNQIHFEDTEDLEGTVKAMQYHKRRTAEAEDIEKIETATPFQSLVLAKNDYEALVDIAGDYLDLEIQTVRKKDTGGEIIEDLEDPLEPENVEITDEETPYTVFNSTDSL